MKKNSRALFTTILFLCFSTSIFTQSDFQIGFGAAWPEGMKINTSIEGKKVGFDFSLTSLPGTNKWGWSTGFSFHRTKRKNGQPWFIETGLGINKWEDDEAFIEYLSLYLRAGQKIRLTDHLLLKFSGGGALLIPREIDLKDADPFVSLLIALTPKLPKVTVSCELGLILSMNGRKKKK